MSGSTCSRQRAYGCAAAGRQNQVGGDVAGQVGSPVHDQLTTSSTRNARPRLLMPPLDAASRRIYICIEFRDCKRVIACCGQIWQRRLRHPSQSPIIALLIHIHCHVIFRDLFLCHAAHFPAIWWRQSRRSSWRSFHILWHFDKYHFLAFILVVQRNSQRCGGDY